MVPIREKSFEEGSRPFPIFIFLTILPNVLFVPVQVCSRVAKEDRGREEGRGGRRISAGRLPVPVGGPLSTVSDHRGGGVP